MELLEYELEDLSRKEIAANKEGRKHKFYTFALCFLLNLFALCGEVEGVLISSFSGDSKRSTH